MWHLSHWSPLRHPSPLRRKKRHGRHLCASRGVFARTEAYRCTRDKAHVRNMTKHSWSCLSRCSFVNMTFGHLRLCSPVGALPLISFPPSMLNAPALFAALLWSLSMSIKTLINWSLLPLLLCLASAVSSTFSFPLPRWL